MQIVPSARTQWLQDTIGGTFAAVAFGVVLCLGRVPLPIASLIGLAFCAAGVISTRHRFRTESPLKISADENGLTVLGRDGHALELRSAGVREASHTTVLGSKWTFESGDRQVIVRDDGITVEEWGEFSDLIVRTLLDLGGNGPGRSYP